MGFEGRGGHAKKYGFKGGGREKILAVKGEGVPHPKRILSSFVVTTSVITGSLTTASKTSPKK